MTMDGSLEEKLGIRVAFGSASGGGGSASRGFIKGGPNPPTSKSAVSIGACEVATAVGVIGSGVSAATTGVARGVATGIAAAGVAAASRMCR